jgi:L-cysteine:1D-myo-inositol 2-amino-2-deoxy-alpha-D-glucopyranoside ligase
MRSWPTVEVPRIPGESPVLQLHDTRSASLVESAPAGEARLYVCGITPYDATHLGHAATYLAFDLLHRQWLDRGIAVAYVQNVTDVDDPLLERAAATGVDWPVLAGQEIGQFRADMEALRILPPSQWCGVIESMGQITELINALGEAAYLVDDDHYFDVRADPEFGRLAGLDEGSMLTLFAERGGDPRRPGKRHPLDCLLWRGAREGEPSWPSQLGPGRPGWHVECAAIAHAHLGSNIDVLGGGSDLVFPHHEMSAAEIAVATGEPAAKTYMHAGMVAFGGAKMAKSDGNLVLVSELTGAGHDPMAIRLALLARHYRADWEWTDRDIDYAEARRVRWTAGLERTSTPPAAPLIERLRRVLARDLHAPEALAAVDDWCASPGSEEASDEVRRALDALLGVSL